MTDPATAMFAEAREAAEVVARQLAVNRALYRDVGESLRRRPPALVVTCARGSSDHAATYLKHLVETRVGVAVASAAPSTASLYGAAPGGADVLTVALSQSGASPDLLATVDAATGRTMALVNVTNSPLAARVDTVVPLHAGPERSVAATKSYIATLAAAAALTAEWSSDAALAAALEALPDGLQAAWDCDWGAFGEAFADVNGLYVIGRGPGFGIAQEAALKFKETCGLHAEAFSAAEVRHGPMALIGPDLPLLVFRQDDASAPSIDALITDMVGRGTVVLVASAEPVPAGAIHLPLPGSDPAVAPILAIAAFYRAVNALSVRRGFEPDRPPSLRKVTETV